MSTVSVFSNPIRRRRRRKHARRNPSRRRRHSSALGAYVAGPGRIRRRKLNPIRGRRHHRRHRRRNPIGGEMGTVLVPALFGAGGALGLNILLGYMSFLPATLQTGYGRAGVQIAGALAIGALGPKMGLSRNTSYAIAAGISVIALYDVASSFVASKFPNVNLGEQFTALPSTLMLPHAQKSGGYGEQFQAVPPSQSEAPQHTFG